MDYSIDGDDEDTNKSNNTSDKASYIGKEEALAIALAHSKVDKNQATELKVDFDYDDNKAVYEIDFETNDAEYEYKIDAKTGEPGFFTSSPVFIKHVREIASSPHVFYH